MANSHCHRLESFSRVQKLYLFSQHIFGYRRRRLANRPAGERRRTRHRVAYKLVFADENLATFRDNNISVDTVDGSNY